MLKPKIIIIGGGIVGLATAYRLQQKKPDFEVTVLEKESKPGLHQTGHNSGVIHAGLYYQPSSLKAKLCVSGRLQMIDFCTDNSIPFELCGKAVVATNQEEIPRLQNLFERGIKNGLKGLELVGPEVLKEREPHAGGLKALIVPEEGIVDYGRVCEKLAEKVISNGGTFKTNSSVAHIESRASSSIIRTTNEELEADFVINCAGLHADRFLNGVPRGEEIRIVPFRGEYYSLKAASRHLVKHLIYPVPDPAFPFLGVHFTRGISGDVECGPNAVLALKREGYRKSDISLRDIWDFASFPGFWKFSAQHWKMGLTEVYRSFSKRAFCKSLQKLVPSIQSSDLEPGGSGVRAQAMDITGNLIQDFSIIRKERILHILNTPSPAATASLAIGQYIATKCRPLL
jgi:(S)-2-hydroxyglutarate dehydrogenase